MLRSVWALVYGAFAQAFFIVIFSFLALRGSRMKLGLNREDIKIIIARGKWIVGHSMLTALAQAADRLLLGFVMSSSVFGFYFLARQIIDIVMGFLNSVNSQMGLQVFRHILQTSSFTHNYYKYRLIFDAMAGLSAGGLFVMAPFVVDLIYDDRYADVAPFVQLLVVGILLVGPLLLREAYSAERKFKEMTILSLISTGTLWLGLLITIFVFENIPASLIVIALHRLPEAVILGWLGARRSWLVLWREGLVLVFFGIGFGLGWAILEAWTRIA
jgi:O-antigen/teichoic acid export membrane protein